MDNHHAAAPENETRAHKHGVADFLGGGKIVGKLFLVGLPAHICEVGL